MADISERGDLASHPDVHEMRSRYDRMMGRRDVALLDAPVFLVGLYCLISPWVVNTFAATQPELAMHNMFIGIAIALLALGFTLAPERMYGMSWAMCAIGVWMVISPWMVGTDPGMGIVWSNIAVGAIVFLLGLACARQVMSRREPEKMGE